MLEISHLKDLQTSASWEHLIGYISDKVEELKARRVSSPEMSNEQIVREVRAKDIALAWAQEILDRLQTDTNSPSPPSLREYEVFPK